MRIGIINVDSQPEFMGGIKRVSLILADEWMRREHQLFLLSLCPTVQHIPHIPPSIEQTALPDYQTIFSEANKAVFANWLTCNRIDIVLHPHVEEHGMTRLCIEVCRAVGTRLVVALHFSPTHAIDIANSYFFLSYQSVNKCVRFAKELFRWSYWQIRKKKQLSAQIGDRLHYLIENADRVVLLSDSFLPIFERMALVSYERDRSKLVAINDPIKPANVSYTPKEYILLWCGRVEYGTKRFDRMLRIWQQVAPRHPDWRCVVMGSGDIEKFRSIISTYHIPRIHFTGFCDPIPYYRQSSVLCMTSSSEGWGMVLVEAQQYGCVPIAYNSYASLKDVITDGENGYCIPAFREDLFINQLERLMRDEALRERLAQNGRESVRRFDSPMIASQWIQLFETCLV
jgi:glycosyltransferase involved in cell wall biosynthesis